MLLYENLINVYVANGVIDLDLRNIEDLMRCHGVNIKDIDGYDSIPNYCKDKLALSVLSLYNSYPLTKRPFINIKCFYFAFKYIYKSLDDYDDMYFVVKSELYHFINHKRILVNSYCYQEGVDHKIVNSIKEELIGVEYEFQGGKKVLYNKIKDVVEI